MYIMFTSTFKLILGLFKIAILLSFYTLVVVLATTLELFDSIFSKSK